MAWWGRAVGFVRSVTVGRSSTSVAGTSSVLVSSALRCVASSGRSVRASVGRCRRGRCGRESTRTWRSGSVRHSVTLIALAVSASTTELVASEAASSVALSTVAVAVTRWTVLAVAVVAVAAATSAAHSMLRHLNQLRVDYLVGLAQHVDEVAGLVRVGVGEERVCGSGVVGAAGTPDAVDVILRVGRVVVVDYELYVLHVCLLWFVSRRLCVGVGVISPRTHIHRECVDVGDLYITEEECFVLLRRNDIDR